ncbi:MAG TPA: hypothetical protein VFZ96_08815 [Actinomycetota bacterium]|nr:hypothetical protein [Actinomycetota bacterium]
MAIKGKSKAKGGAKPVTRGPRPTYVPVRRPLLQRRSFWYPVIAVVVVASALGIWYGIAQERDAERERELEASLRRTVTDYQEQVDPVLLTVGTPIPSGYDTFPEFEDALNTFIDGQGKSADLRSSADATAQAAGTAAEDLEAIEASTLVAGKGFDAAVALFVINSQSRMAQGLRAYENAALLASDAAAAGDDQGVGLARRAKEQVALAKDIFADGYQDYIEVQVRAGTYQPVVDTGLP